MEGGRGGLISAEYKGKEKKKKKYIQGEIQQTINSSSFSIFTIFTSNTLPPYKVKGSARSMRPSFSIIRLESSLQFGSILEIRSKLLSLRQVYQMQDSHSLTYIQHPPYIEEKTCITAGDEKVVTAQRGDITFIRLGSPGCI